MFVKLSLFVRKDKNQNVDNPNLGKYLGENFSVKLFGDVYVWTKIYTSSWFYRHSFRKHQDYLLGLSLTVPTHSTLTIRHLTVEYSSSIELYMAESDNETF